MRGSPLAPLASEGSTMANGSARQTRVLAFAKLGIWVIIVFVLAFALYACSANGSGGDSDSESGSTLATTEEVTTADWAWSEDADCATCHEEQALSQSDSDYQLCESHGTLDCLTCHTDTEGLAAAHEEVTAEDTDGAKKLKETSVENEVCLSCHEDDYTPEATEDITALTDNNGTLVNPHDMPDTETHAENITCASCHDMHSDKTTEESASTLCISCHHKNVYECDTCHER